MDGNHLSGDTAHTTEDCHIQPDTGDRWRSRPASECSAWSRSARRPRADIQASCIAKIASSCFYQLRRLKQVRRYVDNDVMAQLVATFVTSRLDYCNAVLAAIPKILDWLLLSSGSRTSLHDLFSVSDHSTTQPQHFVNCTGCQSSIVYSTNCLY